MCDVCAVAVAAFVQVIVAGHGGAGLSRACLRAPRGRGGGRSPEGGRWRCLPHPARTRRRPALMLPGSRAPSPTALGPPSSQSVPGACTSVRPHTCRSCSTLFLAPGRLTHRPRRGEPSSCLIQLWPSPASSLSRPSSSPVPPLPEHASLRTRRSVAPQPPLPCHAPPLTPFTTARGL